MAEDYQAWLWSRWSETCVDALRNHDFDAHAVESAAAAREKILEWVSGFETFGFGGSDTTRRLGLVEALQEAGKTVYDHWKEGLSREEDLQLRLDQGRCDCFFCSANAISLTGEIVNVDGVGNRTNAATYGPRKVIIAAGMNKVTPDLDSALRRVRDVAGPMRAKSLNMKTPCAETGLCSDCNAPQRICRVTSILHRKPFLTDISVVLIHEKLGF